MPSNFSYLRSLVSPFRQGTARPAPTSEVSAPQSIHDVNQQRVEDACNAIASNPRDPVGYIQLADALRVGEIAPIIRGLPGEPLTQKECYRKVAELDPNNANAFRQLGRLLRTNEIIRVGDKDLSKKDCVDKGKIGTAPLLFFSRRPAFNRPNFSVFGRNRLNRTPVPTPLTPVDEPLITSTRSAIPGTPRSPDNASAYDSSMRDSDVPILGDSRTFAARSTSSPRAGSERRESYKIPMLDDNGKISSCEVLDAELAPDVAQDLHNFLSRDNGYEILVEALQNAKLFNDIATNPYFAHLTTPPYEPPPGKVRTYYQTFNQAMESKFLTAQTVMSKEIPLKKSKAISVANQTNRAIHLGMPNAIVAGLLGLAQQKQDTKTLNNLSKIGRFFQDRDQLKHVTRAVSKAICITQEEALNVYSEEQDAAAKGSKTKAFKGFIHGGGTAPSAPSTLGTMAKEENLKADLHLEATEIGRKALRDVHLIFDAIIALPEKEFADMDQLTQSQRIEKIVEVMNTALNIQALEADENETKRPAPEAGKSSATGESSGLTNQVTQDSRQWQQLAVKMEQRFQEQEERINAQEKQIQVLNAKTNTQEEQLQVQSEEIKALKELVEKLQK
jgi:hypothetical protein